MDKQKQIEEMAKYCCNPCEMSWGCDSGYCSERGRDAYKTCRLAKETAEKLYNAGYRKEESVRKETAKKFAERLKEHLEDYSPFVGYDLEDLEFDGETIQECIDEICKEITEM